MRRPGAPVAAAAVMLAMAVACEKQEFEPPDRAGRVAQADSLFDAAVFDTVTWASDSLRFQAGNDLYTTECRQCHGTIGEGGTEYARSRAMDPPSLIRPDWPEGDDLEAVRRRVFTGHPGGMPTFGSGNLSPRQIDAVAYYITYGLRSEFASRPR
jgi:mono/diheme cytochrome c family protein